MRWHAREEARPRWPGCGRRAALLAALLLVSGCRAPGGELRIAERIPVPHPGAVTLAVLLDGRVALGEPGGLLLGVPGEPLRRVDLGTGGVPRVVGEAAGRLLLAVGGDSMMVVSSTSDSVLAAGRVPGIPLLDVRGRMVFAAGGSGEVVIYEPDSLRPVSAWAARGQPATAIAASPEGDRIYLPLEQDHGSTVLTRDLQTGRILRRNEFTAPFSSLTADPYGNLLGVLGGAGSSAVVSLRPWGTDLELRWRLRLGAEATRTTVRPDRQGARVAVISHGETKAGLRVLDAETGLLLGVLAEPPLDAAHSPEGRLLLLYPGEIRIPWPVRPVERRVSGPSRRLRGGRTS